MLQFKIGEFSKNSSRGEEDLMKQTSRKVGSIGGNNTAFFHRAVTIRNARKLTTLFEG